MESSVESFYESVVRDPLFAAEGMSIESAEKAVCELERATQLQEDFYWNRAKELRWFLLMYPFSKSLRPVPFLKKFIAAERMRRVFLGNPSRDSAAALIALWEETGKALEKSARRNFSALRMVGKIEKLDKTNVDYQFHKYAVTYTQVLENYRDIVANAEAIRKEVVRRKRILNGTESWNFKINIPDANPIPYTLSGPPLAKEFSEILELEKKTAGNPGTEYGPIFYTIGAFDKAPTTHQFFAYISPLPAYGPECHILKITLADERYFLEINPEKYKFHQSIAQYKPLVRRGIPFFHYHPTAPYAVRDLLFWADIATVADLTWRRPELDARLVTAQKSSCLDMLLWYSALDCLTSLRSTKAVMNEGDPLNPLSYFYIARSFPSLYYLTFNKSVWRAEKRPDFNGSRFTNNISVHKTYREIAHLLTPKLMEEIFNGYRYRFEDWKKEGVWED